MKRNVIMFVLWGALIGLCIDRILFFPSSSTIDDESTLGLITRSECEAIAANAVVTSQQRSRDGVPSSSSNGSPLVSQDDYFYLKTPFMPVSVEGLFVFPSGVSRVWLDIGTHARAGVTRPALDKPENSDLAIIGFEPMRYQYGEISTANIDGYGYGHERMFVMNAVASEQRGFLTFHRSKANMCSSILKSVKGKKCHSEKQVDVTVASVPLEDVLTKIPAEFEVEFVKIDAQGADFSVLKSAGAALKRVNKFQLEVQTTKMYEGSAEQKEIVDWMTERGFSLESQDGQSHGDEKNLVFLRDKN